jgi:hypothetical protein
VQAFRAIERRFVWQARTAVLIVGLTGFYMTARLDLWDRFRSAEFWWMYAMVCVWRPFTLILFAAERHSSCIEISTIGNDTARGRFLPGCTGCIASCSRSV